MSESKRIRGITRGLGRAVGRLAGGMPRGHAGNVGRDSIRAARFGAGGRARLAAVLAATVVCGAVSVGAAPVAAAKPNPDDYYPPTIHRLSEKQVETMKSNLELVDNACDLIPLPYIPSLACRNGKEMADVVNKAYFRDTGLIGKYYIHKGITSLNYYEWEVAKPPATAPAGRVGSGLGI
jgi:hypothetical protein